MLMKKQKERKEGGNELKNEGKKEGRKGKNDIQREE